MWPWQRSRTNRLPLGTTWPSLRPCASTDFPEAPWKDHTCVHSAQSVHSGPGLSCSRNAAPIWHVQASRATVGSPQAGPWDPRPLWTAPTSQTSFSHENPSSSHRRCFKAGSETRASGVPWVTARGRRLRHAGAEKAGPTRGHWTEAAAPVTSSARTVTRRRHSGRRPSLGAAHMPRSRRQNWPHALSRVARGGLHDLPLHRPHPHAAPSPLA